METMGIGIGLGLGLEPSQEYAATADVSPVRFAKILEGLGTVAGTDDTRGYISGIHIRCDEDAIVLSATNGHIAVAKRIDHWAESDAERIHPFDFMLPWRQIRLVAQALRSLKADFTTKLTYDRYAEDNTIGSASFGSPAHAGIVTIATTDVDFPSFRGVVPAGDSQLESGRIKLNVGLVAPYFQKVYGSREGHKIEMRFSGKGSGIEILDENDPGFYAILMPLWSDENDPVTFDPPAWLK